MPTKSVLAMAPQPTSSLQRYAMQMGQLTDRRLTETALMAAKRLAEQEAERAKRAAEEVEKSNQALREEIRSRMAVQAELEHLAGHDLLTRLPNRLLFNQRLEQEMAKARRQGQRIALLFLDLDRFKDVNDTLGHQAGDELLVQIASRVRCTLRQEDTVARMGGDEFAIIQAGEADEASASALATRVLEAMEAPVSLAGHLVFVGGSIGITLYPDDGSEAAQLQRNADLAMYRAKNESRNAYRFYNVQLDADVQRRCVLEQDMRSALARKEFAMHYQPKLCVRSGRLIGAEALIRWKRGNEWISPAEFIPVAERTGFINDLGEWTLREVCTQLARWRPRFPHLEVAVNLSTVQFKSPSFLDRMRETIRSTHINPANLELEVTETAMMGDMSQCNDILGALRQDGFRITLDDFGTGYSSLNYLATLPVDRLKIDRSFLQDLGGRRGGALASCIAALGHNLGLEVVAEGIETHAQLGFVRNAGCHEAQGYLIGKAMPGSDLETRLNGWDIAEWADASHPPMPTPPRNLQRAVSP